ncbi:MULTISPECIES: ACT domain-containing protein [Breznakia]|uniref:Chorismate mutase n=1 Tax=Breznakia blatticola TaxID=1754012 RepID=A0A4R7ZG60_9FIRM|nr:MULTISPECIES: ACT domain-containing protein [Breznakia]MDH6367093.1 chorismate mutase [Breznakia sp. PH1-1]MDH6404320.1 chorismate mutase [Breznakia sp. PF1-11]MDH6411980.1 chorismate mutase [Breznakia sp. PFB1-11]MDH6414308.1 chorismate mutase [Breznakia sp. PFB1-14]MDH6416594.1 chorismate mutase [Breznakia sp. PFB1-4]
MLDSYLIVSKEVLPEVILKVIEVKKILETKEDAQVSDVTREVGISRSAFYKYKDHVFEPSNTNLLERKALIAFTLSDEKGILSEALLTFSAFGCNILTINQNIPIAKRANVVTSIDVKDMKGEIQELINRLQEIKGLSKVRLLSIE